MTDIQMVKPVEHDASLNEKSFDGLVAPIKNASMRDEINRLDAFARFRKEAKHVSDKKVHSFHVCQDVFSLFT